MEYLVNIGIKTEGPPVLKEFKDHTLVENMLIGDTFHWQQTIVAKLPGQLSVIDKNKGNNSITLSESDRNVTLINTLPLEKYLECVVASEMNPSSPSEFLKAHAVISRSWVLGKINRPHIPDRFGEVNTREVLIGWDDDTGHVGFHVCSDDHCQRYQGLQPLSEETLKAIRETKNEVIISNDGELIDARYSKCCGGETELFSSCWQSRDKNYLKKIIDPWCNLDAIDPASRRLVFSSILKEYDLSTQGYGFLWTSEISKEDIRKNLKHKFNRDIGVIEDIRPLHRGPSGRIDLLRIKGSHGCLDLGKELWIRRLLSTTHLYSSAFDIVDKGDTIVLNGRGWGHGVGLCQMGAANMALHGFSYKDILTFYYPGAKIIKI